MRRWLAGTVGLVCSASLLSVHAQAPHASGRPKVRVSAVRSIEESEVRARGQMGTSPMGMPPMGGSPIGSAPAGSAPSPMGSPPQTPSLPMPRPFGPTVSELPSTPNPGATPAGPASSFIAPQGHIYTPTAAVNPQAAAVGADMGLFPSPNMDPPQFGGVYGAGLPGAAAVASTPYVHKWWLSGEYLLWWTKSAQFPTLLTTSSPAFNGIPGTGDTRSIFGNGSFGETLHSGGRFGAGYWFGCDQCLGIETSIFFLGRNGDQFVADSGVYPVLARPFTNLNQNIPFSQLIASNILASGAAVVNFENSVWGAEANFRKRLVGNPCYRLDFLAGFRFMEINDELSVTEYFRRTPNSPTSVGVPEAVSGIVFDRFRTENQFYGGQIGLSSEIRRGRWFTSLTTKVAFGTVFQSVTIDGGQNVQLRDGSMLNARGGLLAVPGANIGTYRQNRFGVMPEVGFQFGYYLTRHCRVFMGYNFLYLNSVLRPGDQIDTGLDVTRIPNFPVSGVTPLPSTRPIVPMKETDFFAQGLSFGLQFTW